jgi:hypothetical protein
MLLKLLGAAYIAGLIVLLMLLIAACDAKFTFDVSGPHMGYLRESQDR